MMKKTITILGILSFGLVYSQSTEGKVGVNTETPDATLQVKSYKGTTDDQKNLELENANSKKLVTVLNKGVVGINNEKPQYLLDVTSSAGDYYRNSIVLRSFRDAPATGALDFYRGRGNSGAIQPVQTGDTLMTIGTYAYLKNQKLENVPAHVFDIRAVVRGNVDTDVNTKQSVPTSLEFCRYDASIGKDVNRYNTVLVITPNDEVAIGYTTYPGTAKDPVNIKSTLDVKGTISATTLAGVGDRNVVADKDGILKIGGAVSTEVKATTPADGKVCDQNTVGSIFYKEISGNGVFGFCTKKGNDYVWGYMVGGSNVYGTSTAGAKFGEGL